MPASYEEIDYRIRPAKHVERKMLCETFQRLSEFASLDSYRYIGLGSVYFADFVAIHRLLGLTNMVSIEKDEHKKDRFEFNKPYACIQVEYGHTNAVLPALAWDARSIVWLDYDGPLEDSVLTDISSFCSKATPGSFLVVSVNCTLEPEGSKQIDVEADASEDDVLEGVDAGGSNSTEGRNLGKDRLEILRSRLETGKIPAGIVEADLAGWKAALTYRRIIMNEIDERIKEQNGTRKAGSKLHFQQVINFRYADGAKMLTIGGILYDDGLRGKLAGARFSDLPFYRDDEKSQRIEVPKLTLRELRFLDQQLPCDTVGSLVSKKIPQRDLRRYRELYRWFPTFADAEV